MNIHTHLWGSILSLAILILHVFNHFSIFTSFFNLSYIKSLTHSSIFLPPILKSSSTSSSISDLSSIYNLNLIDPIIRESDWKDTLGFTIFLLSAVCCLGLSATFHTCVCHSQKVSFVFLFRKVERFDLTPDFSFHFSSFPFGFLDQ